MPLFQKTVVAKYLKHQAPERINQKWNLFTAHFQNPAIQENIRNAKEEQYQEGFLRDLFVNILGYTLNPADGFNLTTEYKNVKDSRKADAAILLKGEVRGIIELKGTNITDLTRIEEQAFSYKNNQPECKYVITSNFEKLRFYIDNAIEHIEWDLFALTRNDFELFYGCLAFENLEADIPAKIKAESLSEEDAVTKKLYKDYSAFKRELFQNLVENNPEHNPLELFKRSQKLLDRLLFLYFGEDRGLLPPNSVRKILAQWKQLQELDEYVPLYNRFLKYFGYLNTGFKGKQYDVFAYNGGLFKDDEILDHVRIDDELLYRHCLRLSEYDFASEVDVNILGHIFEHSLNEIDEVKAKLEGTAVDKAQTKRKKDGVYYTPKYITKYIVENTVGRLCTEQKAALGIVEEDFRADQKPAAKKKLIGLLNAYRDWLLQLTIVDPACGSGAFLNEALNFLIAEHHLLDELETKLTGGSIVFANVENSILENNLYGVDLNEESVEIAKLSLWLRTAKPGRKLNDLNSNIQCGNSLIDDPAVAGDKAFNWQEAFPHVFEKGGFDVVIGNPPYGINIGNGKEYFAAKYLSSEGAFELYKFFIEKSLTLLKIKGLLGFITPDTWTNLSYFRKLRELIITNYKLLKCSVSLYNVFEDAIVDTSIFIISNERSNLHNFIGVNQDLMTEFNGTIIENGDDFSINFKSYSSIIQKMSEFNKSLDQETEIWRGMSAYGAKNPARPYNSRTKDSDEHKKLLNGGNIARYSISWDGEYIKYGAWLHRPRPSYIYENPKILVQRIRNPKLKQRIISVYDDEGYISSDGLSNILLREGSEFSLKALIGIINSKLINYWFSYFFFDVNIKPEQLRQIPLPNGANGLEGKVILMLDKNRELQGFIGKFQRNLQREFSLEKLSTKLQSWQELSYTDFLKELKKAKVNLTLSQKAEWESYFNTEKQKAAEIQHQIDTTDAEIDQMVYALYGLNEEEIRIVEEG